MALVCSRQTGLRCCRAEKRFEHSSNDPRSIGPFHRATRLGLAGVWRLAVRSVRGGSPLRLSCRAEFAASALLWPLAGWSATRLALALLVPDAVSAPVFSSPL